MKLSTLLLLSSSLLLTLGLVRATEEADIEDEIEMDEEEYGDPSSSSSPLSSPLASTRLLFTRPHQTVSTYLLASKEKSSSVELPSGKLVELLIGLTNVGEKSSDELVLETLDASFRYPMDFSFHIQNFSLISLNNRVVKKGEESTLAYSLIPADAFAGRAIGLTVNLAYRDTDGNFFLQPIFNETVMIVDFNEGFDSEVFFMWIFIAAAVVLVLFLIVTLLSNKKGPKPTSSSQSKVIETGTAHDDVDYEWIPKSALRTPGGSKSSSPRQRRGKANRSGSDTE